MNNALNNPDEKSSGYATDFILVEFCTEVFHGGRWQRQHCFSSIFGIVAQFFNLIELLIFSLEREGRISRL